MESFWKWRVVPENLGFFASGFRLTLTIFVLAWIGCWAFAVVFGAMRHSSRPWLSYPAAAIVEIIRGTPGLMFVVWVYFLSQPLIGYALSPFWAAVWALVIRSVALFKNTSLAFVIGVIEFFRAGTIVNGRENASFSVFTFLAAVYFVCCFSLSRLGHRLGQRPGVIEDTTAV